MDDYSSFGLITRVEQIFSCIKMPGKKTNALSNSLTKLYSGHFTKAESRACINKCTGKVIMIFENSPSEIIFRSFDQRGSIIRFHKGAWSDDHCTLFAKHIWGEDHNVPFRN